MTELSLKEIIELERKERTVGDAGAEQFIGLGRRLHECRSSERARHLLGNAAASADLHTGEILDLVDRPLGVEHLARTMREDAQQLDALVLTDLLQIFPMDAREGHRVDRRGGAAARQLSQQRQDMAGGRIACRDVGDVDEVISDRVESTGRRGRMLRQHLQLDPAVGGLLDLLTPDGQHVFGQQMAWRDPARHREGGGLSSSGLRQYRERRGGHDGMCHKHCAGETGHVDILPRF